MNVEIGAEAALFPEKEYIKGISLQCTYCPTVTAPSQLSLNFPMHSTLQRQFAENPKQIFPEMKLPRFSPSSYLHASVSDLYISLFLYVSS